MNRKQNFNQVDAEIQDTKIQRRKPTDTRKPWKHMRKQTLTTHNNRTQVVSYTHGGQSGEWTQPRKTRHRITTQGKHKREAQPSLKQGDMKVWTLITVIAPKRSEFANSDWLLEGDHGCCGVQWHLSCQHSVSGEGPGGFISRS